MHTFSLLISLKSGKRQETNECSSVDSHAASATARCDLLAFMEFFIFENMLMNGHITEANDPF